APNNEIGYNFFYWIYIADTRNDRIVRLNYDWRFTNQLMYYQTPITGLGLSWPTDVDLNDGGTFWSNGEGSTFQDNYLSVVNSPSGTPFEIKCISVTGSLLATYSSYGCDGQDGHLCRVTSVASGRDPSGPVPFSNINELYVSDVGNNSIVRFVKFNLWAGHDSLVWWQKVPSSNSIADMEVDYGGHLWTVDSTNGTITKYTSDLFPLCTFGSTGIGPNQFIKPICIESQVGYLGNSNMFVIEDWTDSSGGQYFGIGTDIVDFSVTSSFDQYIHFFNFVLVSPSKLKISIHTATGGIVQTLANGNYLSGDGLFIWDGKNSAGVEQPTGEYQVLVVDTSSTESISTGLPTNVVTKHAWFHHEFNCCNTDGIRGDADNTCTASCVNVGDLSFLVDYFYRSGPQPVCPAEGNVNGIGGIDILDLTYLIDRIFRGGPPPPACP
ncbi:MAG: FlgD immunoglobulin-like domain containing protein, partial [Candidatus Zixiibacteriota bacterium]